MVTLYTDYFKVEADNFKVCRESKCITAYQGVTPVLTILFINEQTLGRADVPEEIAEMFVDYTQYLGDSFELQWLNYGRMQTTIFCELLQPTILD